MLLSGGGDQIRLQDSESMNRMCYGLDLARTRQRVHFP